MVNLTLKSSTRFFIVLFDQKYSLFFYKPWDQCFLLIHKPEVLIMFNETSNKCLSIFAKMLFQNFAYFIPLFKSLSLVLMSRTGYIIKQETNLSKNLIYAFN